jgi:hypothetical protein
MKVDQSTLDPSCPDQIPAAGAAISNEIDEAGPGRWELRVTVVSWCALTTGLSPLVYPNRAS